MIGIVLGRPDMRSAGMCRLCLTTAPPQLLQCRAARIILGVCALRAVLVYMSRICDIMCRRSHMRPQHEPALKQKECDSDISGYGKAVPAQRNLNAPALATQKSVVCARACVDVPGLTFGSKTS